jgi:AcrR family transcriptional regulator
MAESSTRDQIISAADELFYHRGYEYTSFTDIAGAVRISRGNFYHHFKSKNEILQAVIELRLENTRKMLAEWEAEGARPAQRIRSFIEILVRNQANIMRFGCPVGTLSSELAKLGHPARDGASKIFTLFRDWLRRQFILLGRPEDADDLAMHLLARSQGVATLANAYRDDNFVQREVDQMLTWLDAQFGVSTSA